MEKNNFHPKEVWGGWLSDYTIAMVIAVCMMFEIAL
jgi:hypothetical protein